MQDLGVFKKDISDAIKKYPKLSFSWGADNVPNLKGEIDIFYDNGENFVSFGVLIVFPENYPFFYPSVWEIGGMFPKSEEYHYLSDGALCLDVRQQIAVKSKNGIKTSDFIDAVLIPNLAWRYCLLNKIPFDKKDYKHGLDGIIEHYEEILETNDIYFILACLIAVTANKLPDRNDPCFCGKKSKFKKCHETAIESLSKIPKNLLKKDISEIYIFLKNKSKV